MSITSYAQNFEDVMLWRAVGHINNGFYIDIGAQHPIIDSVSKAFYENGWRGIHVEATSFYANLIRQDRPDELVLQMAVDDKSGTLNFFEIPDTGLSTGDEAIAEHHRLHGYNVVKVEVPCITLADVFENVGTRDVHWLKIDVEGMESRVLTGWGESVVRPWIIVVESTYPNSQIKIHHLWEDLILEKGYIHAYFDGLSRYYVLSDRQDLLQKLNDPPNIFDGFSLALSAPYNAPARELLKLQKEKFQHEITAEIDKVIQEKEALRQSLEQREHEVNTQLQTVQQQSEQEKTALVNDLNEQAHALRVHHAALEKALTQQLQNEQQDLQRLSEEVTQRDKDYAEQIRQYQQELRKLLSDQLYREQEFSGQLLGLQQQAAHERSELTRVYSEQTRYQYNDQAEREKSLLQQLQSGKLEVQRLRQKLEDDHFEQVSQTRDKIENLLRQQAHREHEVAKQLLKLEQDKALLALKYSEQTNTLRDHHSAQEYALNQQLVTRQQEIYDLLQNRLAYEQQIAEQMLALRHQAAEEIAAQIRNHREQESNLHNQHAQREEELKQRLQTKYEELHDLHASHAMREQDIENQLHTIRHQASQEVKDQICKHQEQLVALHQQQIDREIFLSHQLQAGQDEILRLTKELEHSEQSHAETSARSDEALDKLLVNQRLREQEIHAQLLDIHENSQQEVKKYSELLENSLVIESHLNAEIESGLRSRIQLQQLLNELQKSLDANQASLSWRITAPLRIIEKIFSSTTKNSLAENKNIEILTPEKQKSTAPEQHSSIVYEEILSQTTMPASVQQSHLNMPIIVSTLEQLLALDGLNFVESAYRSLLKRAPDIEGESYYLARLEAGHSKISILSQIHFSKEGRLQKPNIQGFENAIKKQNIKRIPLIGWLFSSANQAEGNGPVERKLRVIELKILNSTTESVQNFRNLDQKLTETLKLISQQSQAIEFLTAKTALETSALENSLHQLNERVALRQENSSALIVEYPTQATDETYHEPPDAAENTDALIDIQNELQPLTIEDLIKISHSNEELPSIRQSSNKEKPLTLENLLELSTCIK